MQDSREDRTGNYTETLTYVWTGSGGLPVNSQGQPAGTESLSDPATVIQSLSRSLLNSAGQVTQSLEYTSLPSSGYSTSRTLGVKGTNYLETDTTFDSLGRAAATYQPSGTIDHQFFDANGNVIAEWQGTCDVPQSDYDGDGDNGVYDADDFRAWVAQNPTATVGPAGTNMVKISGSVYDGGQAGGDGLLTESDSYYGSGSGNYYARKYQYDWRDRQTGSLGPDGVATMPTLDNLGDTTETQSFAGSTYSSGQIVTGNLRSQSTTLLDTQNRAYESRTYQVSVNPTTGVGTAGDYLPTDTWYDPRGLVVKTVTGNGPFQKASYDGAGREIFAYTCYNANESPTNYSAAMSVTGDTVVDQTQTWYDAGSRVVAAAEYQRFPTDNSSTGALTAANSYVTASVDWYDNADRPTYQVNYGREDTGSGQTHYIFDTNGNLIAGSDGNPLVSEETPPAPNSSNDYIVSETVYDPVYNAVGPVVETIDNAGQITWTQSDLMGRTLRTIENYVPAGLDQNGNPVAADTAEDVTTDYQYDTFGRLATLTAYDANGSTLVPEQTKYFYQSTLDASLQTTQVSPDSTDTLSQDSTTLDWTITNDTGQETSTTYDWMGRATTQTDERGVVHSYTYDSAGRLTDDIVTSLGRSGQNVDGTVRRISTAYDDVGRVHTVTSYADTAGTTVVNQVQDAYDGWGNLIQEWQAQTGAVVVGTTPSVQYTYADGATGGVAAYVRMTDVIYPNGRDISYSYGTAGGMDDILSRTYEIGSGSDTYSSYAYLGAGTIVTESYLEPQVQLDYSANNYAAWDRFGRVVAQIWATYGQNPTTLDGYDYTYDRASNRTARANVTDSALNEIYGYDGVNRLTSDTRNGNAYQQWTLDSLGNWTGFTNNSQTTNETFDPANELTGGTGIVTPAYDAAGNMTTTPSPSNPQTGLTCTYDAWNRMVQVASGTTILGQYRYDGQNRRTENLTNFNTSGVPQNVVYYFYSGQQVVETRAGARTSSPSSLPPQYQYIWSLRYIDAPIQRDSFNGSGQIQPASRLFYLADANYNVTALVNTSGQVVERYVYDPYGAVTVYKPDWSGTQSPTLYNNTVLYTGKVLDVETGLYYYLARYYQPALGRFIASDPTGFWPGDANLYQYCGDSPTNATDPAGMLTRKHMSAPSANAEGMFHTNWKFTFAHQSSDPIAVVQKLDETIQLYKGELTGGRIDKWKQLGPYKKFEAYEILYEGTRKTVEMPGRNLWYFPPVDHTIYPAEPLKDAEFFKGVIDFVADAEVFKDCAGSQVWMELHTWKKRMWNIEKEDGTDSGLSFETGMASQTFKQWNWGGYRVADEPGSPGGVKLSFEHIFLDDTYKAVWTPPWNGK